ncbi:MAG: SIS domain-containing protein [Candidatus Acidiferrales bacterium]
MQTNKNLKRLVRKRIEESAAVKLVLLVEDETIGLIAEVAVDLATAFRDGRRLFLFGNGGSAADAQHIAAEIAGKYLMDRRALPALALTVNPSSLTAIANDHSYEEVFARQLEAFASTGDVALGISASGDSPNVLRAIEMANAKGLMTVGLTGRNGGKLKSVSHRCICVPSEQTPRIQEIQMLVGHILSEIVEQELFTKAAEPVIEFANVT